VLRREALEGERFDLVVARGMVFLVNGKSGWGSRQILGKFDRVLYIAALRGLVAACEQDDQLAVPLREVHAVARADINL
jgi:hypothetical protein